MAVIATRGGVRLGNILQWEQAPHIGYSRKTVVIREAAAADYFLGDILGQVTTGGKYKKLTVGATDGSQNFAGIFIGSDSSVFDQDKLAVPANTDKTGVVLFRDAAVGKAYLNFPSGTTELQKAAVYAQMEAAGIKLIDQVKEQETV
jgi:hypothetical protein